MCHTFHSDKTVIYRKMKLTHRTCFPGEKEKKDLSPIIMLHNLVFCKYSWKEVQEKIAKRTGRVVYAVDLRDHGENEWSDHFCDVKCADDIEEFMDDRGIRNVILIGQHFGATIAIHVALRRPDKVERLFLMEMNYYVPNTSPQTVNQMLINAYRRSVSSIPPNSDEDTAKRLFIVYYLAFDETGVSFSENQKAKDNAVLWNIKKAQDGSWETTFNLDAIEKFNNSSCSCKEDYGYKTYLGPTAVLCDKKYLSLTTEQRVILKNHFPSTDFIQTAHPTKLFHFKLPDVFSDLVTKFIDGKMNSVHGAIELNY